LPADEPRSYSLDSAIVSFVEYADERIVGPAGELYLERRLFAGCYQ
jgi:hypothetical protein